MGNQKETQKNPQYKYASTREKLCFGIGAMQITLKRNASSATAERLFHF